jgi:hypothetical protein
MNEQRLTAPVAERSTEMSSRGRLVRPFPAAGDLLAAVQAEWDVIKPSDDPFATAGLPRPWDPPTVLSIPLRKELWEWLDAVSDWINREHAWDPSESIPPCWPSHPHLVNEIAVLADQRRRAAQEPTSEVLEQWQRVQLPAFTERMRHRIRRLCDDGHQPGAAEAVMARFHQGNSARDRATAFRSDLSHNND